jgi:anti-anti-sigma factor
MRHLNLRRIGDVAVIAPRGFLTGGDETDELDKVFTSLEEEGNRHVVVNLIETVHMTSLALGVFTKAWQRYKALGGKIRLCHLNDRLKSVLVTTQLSDMFEDYPNEREAVQSFAAEAHHS